MLNNSYLVTDSKSIAIDPVVMGITKSKAEELGFINNKVYNKDILNAVKDKKLNYVMNSLKSMYSVQGVKRVPLNSNTRLYVPQKRKTRNTKN